MVLLAVVLNGCTIPVRLEAIAVVIVVVILRGVLEVLLGQLLEDLGEIPVSVS